MTFVKQMLSNVFDILRLPKFKWITLPTDSKPTKTKAVFTDKQRAHNVKMGTAKELLNSLDHIFAENKKKEMSIFASKSTLSTLRNIGSTILPLDWNYDHPKDAKINKQPAVIYLSNLRWDLHADKSKFSDDTVYPERFYAIKHTTCYEVGFMYPGSKRDKRLWNGCTINVDKSGNIVFPKVKVKKPQVIYGRGKGKEHAQMNWHRWEEQEFVTDYMKDCGGRSLDDLRLIITYSFLLWEKRFECWKVTAQKGKERANILISQDNSKHFFKDRKVTVRTPTGQKKKIIHFVTGHSRVLKNKTVEVKEHLRGIREFEWKNYSCYVTAPKFHKFNIDDFSVASDPKRGDTEGGDMMKLISDVERSQNLAIP